MITQKYLKSLLQYDPRTGIFTWRKSTAKCVQVGMKAGHHAISGYYFIRIHGKNYRAHRLAWLYIFGQYPTSELDHINRIKHDNRICNLRAATISENRINTKLHAHNTSGYRGVQYVYNKWKAKIHYQKHQYYLGTYNTKEAAALAYNQAAQQLYGDFAYLNEVMT